MRKNPQYQSKRGGGSWNGWAKTAFYWQTKQKFHTNFEVYETESRERDLMY